MKGSCGENNSDLERMVLVKNSGSSPLHRDLGSNGAYRGKLDKIVSGGQNFLKNGLDLEKRSGVLESCDLTLLNTSIGHHALVDDERIKEYAQRL